MSATICNALAYAVHGQYGSLRWMAKADFPVRKDVISLLILIFPFFLSPLNIDLVNQDFVIGNNIIFIVQYGKVSVMSNQWLLIRRLDR